MSIRACGILFQQGHIVEEETHEYLMEKGNIYQNLWTMQGGHQAVFHPTHDVVAPLIVSSVGSSLSSSSSSSTTGTPNVSASQTIAAAEDTQDQKREKISAALAKKHL